MTNGEKLIEAFPSIGLYKKVHDGIQINFNSEWFNAEYKESRWIPCSEKLPEEDTDVLVTLKCGLIGIMQKKLADDDNGEPCYIWQDFEGEEHEVVAWMPLPKPYSTEK